MSKSILLSKVREPKDDLDEKLAGADGDRWLAALKLFLRKKNPWYDEILYVPFGTPIKRYREVSATAIEVNFDMPLFILSEIKKIEWNLLSRQTGWVRVERIDDELYVGGKKVILHLEPEQFTGRLKVEDLFTRFKRKPILDVRIASALLLNPHLVPENWRDWRKGLTRYVLFCSMGVRTLDDLLRVFVLHCHYDGSVELNFCNAGADYYDDRSPVAVFEG